MFVTSYVTLGMINGSHATMGYHMFPTHLLLQ